MLATIRPKESKANLEPIPNTFAVLNGLVYDYYPTKFGTRRGDWIDLLKIPPVMSEGYVTFEKQLYRVDLRDYFRRRVNVGRAAFTPATTTNSGGASITAAGAPAAAAGTGVVVTGFNTEQSATDSTFGVQINEIADMAWKDQIRSLLYIDDPEAEWEF
jgi:hypothetical protein